MHSFRNTLIIIFIFIINLISSVQSININTYNRKLTLLKDSFKNDENRKYIGSQYFYAVFEKIPDPQMRILFKKNNIDILKLYCRKENTYTYKIKINGNVYQAIENMYKTGILIGIEEILPIDKISPNILDYDQFKLINTYDSVSSTILAKIVYYEKVDEKTTKGYLNKYGIEKIIYYDSISLSFTVQSNRQSLINISETKEISIIYEITKPSETIANARKITNVDSLQKNHFNVVFPPSVSWLSGMPFTGDSIWVTNNEHGSYLHKDFYEMDGADTLLRGDTVLNYRGIRLKKRKHRIFWINPTWCCYSINNGR